MRKFEKDEPFKSGPTYVAKNGCRVEDVLIGNSGHPYMLIFEHGPALPCSKRGNVAKPNHGYSITHVIDEEAL